MTGLDALSLRQLRVLLVLLESRGVSAAARRLGVSQPAMSHALRGLRAALGDPLLVAGARGMAPTPRAAALEAPLRRLLAELEVALSEGPGFDPARATRRFTLATWDGLGLNLLPGLLAHLRVHAPGVDLVVRPLPPDGAGPGLEAGLLDLALEVRPAELPGLRQRAVVDDDFVCVVRADHPAVGATLDLATFLRLPHVLISPQGEGRSVVDLRLAERGLERRVQLRIHSFLAAPLVVARSDLVLTAPRSLAEAMGALAPLRLLPPPLSLPPFTVKMVWHERREADPAHAWLRAAVAGALRGGG
jgi:DNA-binding transcriptional LysR family regulator